MQKIKQFFTLMISLIISTAWGVNKCENCDSTDIKATEGFKGLSLVEIVFECKECLSRTSEFRPKIEFQPVRPEKVNLFRFDKKNTNK